MKRPTDPKDCKPVYSDCKHFSRGMCKKRKVVCYVAERYINVHLALLNPTRSRSPYADDCPDFTPKDKKDGKDNN